MKLRYSDDLFNISREIWLTGDGFVSNGCVALHRESLTHVPRWLPKYPSKVATMFKPYGFRAWKLAPEQRLDMVIPCTAYVSRSGERVWFKDLYLRLLGFPEMLLGADPRKPFWLIPDGAKIVGMVMGYNIDMEEPI